MRFLKLVVWLVFEISLINCTINPIEIVGRHFVDSETHERFYIRGIDYQPGGAAAYDRSSDPLSDPNTCARDIVLFQSLGINTVRVYTINPDLDHSECMTMLAIANIYLVLDVNSPLYPESLNRYEPWTTYTRPYLDRIFRVVHQFSRYNNTLAFFIGNEIINDEKSASVSPAYVRAVTRDVKDYLYLNCPRDVPVGYSAADDLSFRTELPHFLTCGDNSSTVDFYGVNSYQWCGSQTFQSSGYDKLVDDHKNITVPVFLSEYGCNLVQPRLFQEVEALYSENMTSTFDGGLVYEFTQESNDYGLVEIKPNGDAVLLEDFFTLHKRFAHLRQTREPLSPMLDDNEAVPQNKETACLATYPMLPGSNAPVPQCPALDIIMNGVNSKIDSHLNRSILKNPIQSNFSLFDTNGTRIPPRPLVVINNLSSNPIDFVWKPVNSRTPRVLPKPTSLSSIDQASTTQKSIKSKTQTKLSSIEPCKLGKVWKSMELNWQGVFEEPAISESLAQMHEIKEGKSTKILPEKGDPQQRKKPPTKSNGFKLSIQGALRNSLFGLWFFLENLRLF